MLQLNVICIHECIGLDYLSYVTELRGSMACKSLRELIMNRTLEGIL